MHNQTISIFGNKIFLEILNELKLFSEFKLLHYENLDICLKDAEEKNFLVVYFDQNENSDIFNYSVNNFPLLYISRSIKNKKKLNNELKENILIPFNIFEFKKKIISLISKTEFKKNSLIKLNDYIIDKNERKIKKNKIELQLSEKEINFLILFSKTKEPISKKFVLQNVWNYSLESETHTVETHIHRLRKKIFGKFGDNNFIKNNNKGYFI